MLQGDIQGAGKVSNLMTTFFTGKSTARGLIFDRFDKIRNRIEVTMIGRWLENSFRLDETFAYADGTVEERIWSVKFAGDGTLQAHCPSFAGEVKGWSNDEEVAMGYRYPVPIGGRVFNLDFDDHMYRMGENMLLERVRMSKFGITVGEIILTFRK